MDRFTILLSGDITVTKRLRSQIKNTRVIAADGGMRHAALLHVEPILWIGDFDSTSADLAERYHATPRITHPVKKDSTDGALAIDAAIEAGAKELILCGAFGGRSDQSLLHMTMAMTLAERNIPTLLTSGCEEGYPVLPGIHRLTLPSGALFSIIALQSMRNLIIKGAQWSGEWNLDFGSSLCLSNVVDNQPACPQPKQVSTNLKHFPKIKKQLADKKHDKIQGLELSRDVTNLTPALEISLSAGKGILIATLSK